jgi:hypothetical protein
MKRDAIKRWMGVCLLGSALASGCSQTGSRVDDRPPWTAHSVPRPTMNQPVLAQRQVVEPQAQALPNAPMPTTLPMVAPATLPAAAPTTLPAMTSEEKEPLKDTAITQAGLDSSKLSPVSEPAPVRKAFVDITAQPCFNHSEDYSSLTGQLQHSRITKGWRLRYASVDEVDPYGGSVSLSDDSRLSGFKDGDIVSVRGRLTNPEERGIAPAYQIDSVQPVNKQE